MTNFLNSLTALELFFLGCAVLGGLLFLARTLLMFTGGHGDADAMGDADHADADVGFKLLSLQGVTGFFMMFGLVGLALSRQNRAGDLWAVAGGLAAGLGTMWVIARIMMGMKKLQSDGTARLDSAVGQVGAVYLRIPPGGVGQVQIAVGGSLKVVDAVSDAAEELKTGERITVTGLSGASTVAVKKA